MRKLRALVAVVVVCAGIGLPARADVSCAGGTIHVVDTVDKATVLQGDSIGESVAITNSGTSQVTLLTVGRLLDPSGNFVGQNYDESVVLDPGQSRSFYYGYHIPCHTTPGTWTLGRYVNQGTNQTVNCLTQTNTFTISATSMCAGYSH